MLLEQVKEVHRGLGSNDSVSLQLAHMLVSMSILAGGGALCGVVAGITTTVRFSSLGIYHSGIYIQIILCINCSTAISVSRYFMCWRLLAHSGMKSEQYPARISHKLRLRCP
jgi:Na+/H+ antiporter NhaA